MGQLSSCPTFSAGQRRHDRGHQCKPAHNSARHQVHCSRQSVFNRPLGVPFGLPRLIYCTLHVLPLDSAPGRCRRCLQSPKSLPATGRITRAIWPEPSIRRSIKSLPKTSPSWCPPGRSLCVARRCSAQLSRPIRLPAAPGSSSAATPIVVNGVMYLPVGSRVVALDPVTGTEIWSYALPTGVASQRGVAYWPGDKQNPPRILFTSGSKLIALNANTGKIDPGFGKEGEVEMVVPYSGVPTIYKNVAMVGASVGEVPIGPAGDSRAYDARTGAKLWDFHSVPRPGEAGHETWLDDGWKGRSGVNVWGWYMTVDEERGLVYMTFGGPAANYWGGDRPGNNLFANSVVAVDARDGQVQMAFSNHPSRSVGFRSAARAEPDRHREGRPENSGAGANRQGRLDVHSRSHQWQAGIWRRRTSGSQGRRAGRMVFAHAAVSAETAGRWRAWASSRKTSSPPKTPRLNMPRPARRFTRRTAASTMRARSPAWLFHRGWNAAQEQHSVSGRNRRRQLGRHRSRSENRIRVPEHARWSLDRMDREEESRAGIMAGARKARSAL